MLSQAKSEQGFAEMAEIKGVLLQMGGHMELTSLKGDKRL